MNNNSLIINTNAHITTITLNRPEIHNAFNDTLIAELIHTLQHVDQNADTRIVILNANGTSFSAGADIKWMQRMAKASKKENLRDADTLAELMHTLYTLSKPTIALVQGSAYGGGTGLVACCDIAIATSNVNFCFSEAKLGLVPAVISPYIIAATGERIARRYFLTAEPFSAEEAYRIGLIHEVVPATELISVGQRLSDALSQNGPTALATIKRLITDVAQKPIDKTLRKMTVECIANIRVSSEGQEGLNAFLEKRKPKWGPET